MRLPRRDWRSLELRFDVNSVNRVLNLRHAFCRLMLHAHYHQQVARLCREYVQGL